MDDLAVSNHTQPRGKYCHGRMASQQLEQLAVRSLQAGSVAFVVEEMAWRGQRLPWVDSLRTSETMRRVVRATDDAKEGVKAFFEKRSPVWKEK